MVKSVVVNGVALPAGAPGNPSAVVVQNTAFSVTVTFADRAGNPAPPSRTSASTVTLTVEPPAGEPPSASGDAQFVGQHTLVVPAGATTATATGLRLSPADNRIRIGAKVTAGSRDALAIPKGFSAQFDVVVSAVSFPRSQTFISTTGHTTECTATSATPYCADILLPFGTDTGTLLTVGNCDSFLGCSSADQIVVQLLAALGSSYSRTNPATVVYKCDKTTCPGKSIKSYRVFVSLAPTGALRAAPACAAKGVVDEGLDFCLDYVQSKRSNAGDTHLFLLFARDARMSCC